MKKDGEAVMMQRRPYLFYSGGIWYRELCYMDLAGVEGAECLGRGRGRGAAGVSAGGAV